MRAAARTRCSGTVAGPVSDVPCTGPRDARGSRRPHGRFPSDRYWFPSQCRRSRSSAGAAGSRLHHAWEHSRMLVVVGCSYAGGVAFATEHPVLAHSEFRPVSEIQRSEGRFEVVSDYQPSGDQPEAIEELDRRLRAGERDVVLLGATGTGKSATTAWLVERVQRPTLVMAPNKTLAAQLANELRELFPNNAVEYFVSYYDYYQPEAYVPQTDTYIEK